MRPVLLQNRAENLLRPQSLTAQCHIHAWQTMGSALRILGKGAWPASPMGVQTNGGPAPLTAGDGMVPLHSWWSIPHLDIKYFIKKHMHIGTKQVWKIMTVFRQVSYSHPFTVTTPKIHEIGWANVVMSNPLGTSKTLCGSVCCCQWLRNHTLHFQHHLLFFKFAYYTVF